MKKFLSIILAVTMIMSLFCVVPASADAGTASYFFYAFEDGVGKIGYSDNHQTSVVEGGANGSAYATQIDVITTSAGSGISGVKNLAVEAGDILRGSMWMKLPEAQAADSKGIASLILWGNTDTADGKTGKIEGGTYKFIGTKFDTQSTDWQKVTWEYKFKEDHVSGGEYGTIKSMELRMNQNGGGNKTAEGGVDCQYLVDDLELKIVRPYTVEETAAHVTDLFQGDSESWDGIEIASKGKSDVASVVSGTESDAAPAGEKYLRLTRNESGDIKLKLPMTQNLKSNHVYQVSLRMRATNVRGSTSDPAKYEYINAQFRYDHSGLAGGNALGSDDSTYWGSNAYTNQSTAFAHYDARYVNLNKDTSVGDFSQWKHFTWTIYSDKENIQENLSSTNYITFNPTIDYTAHELCTFDFDDFHIYDYGAFTGAGFEYVVEQGNYIGRVLNGNRAAAKPVSYYGWNLDEGALKDWKGTAVADNYSSQMTRINSSLYDNTVEVDGQKFGILYGKLTEDAKMWQYVPMLNGEKYTFTMPIRGVKMKGAGEEVSSFHPFKARLVLERDATNVGANEIYDVSSKAVEYGEWVTIDDGAYKKVSITTDNTFPLIEGKTAIDGIMPKTAKLSIEYANVDDYEGNIFAEKVHAAYIDGGTMTIEADDGIPSITEAEATTAEGGVVTLSYTYSVTGGTATDCSFYKLYDGEAAIATFTNKAAIVIPEANRASGNLKIEIVPISSVGYISDAVTVAVPAAPAPDPVITLTYVEDMGVYITSDTDIESAYLVFATYDENGKMIGAELAEKPITIVANAGEPMIYGTTLEAAYKTKAFLLTDYETLVALTDAIEW